MQQLGERLVLSPSDLINYLECRHLTRIDLDVAERRLELEPARTDISDLVAEKGKQHERGYLESVRAGGKDVVEIDYEPGNGIEAISLAGHRTLEAMRAGAEVIYQAVLFDGNCWRGYADFLERIPRASQLAEWSYEVSDTKLAHRVRPYMLLQLCFYSELLGAAQGTLPERMHVVLGTRERQAFRVPEFIAYYRRVKERFLTELEAGLADTYPEPVEHCGLCRWQHHCDARRIEDDHLGLVAHIRRDQRVRLAGAGIATVAGLARAPDATRPHTIRVETFDALRDQATLQVAERETGEQSYGLLEPEEERGFARLPEPAEGDLFFDIEGDPFFEGGLEYLFGVAWLEEGEELFRAFWATDRAGEKRAFEELIDFIADHLTRYPRAHVYHYAAYEPSALKRLMGIHATREDEVDQLLREKRLVDLYTVVRQGLRISKPSYSLKQVEAFYTAGREAEVTEAEDSIIQFERYLDTGDRSILDEVEEYNREDCHSTRLLRGWLVERRAAAIERFGSIPWREEPEPYEPDAEAAADVDRLQAALLASVAKDAEEHDEQQHSLWLLAQLLDYHRREAKPTWWAYFDRLDADEEQLIERDSEALGGLRETDRAPEPIKQSLLHELSYPAQEHRIGQGSFVDPATQKGVTVEEIDEARGLLKIRRAANRRGEPLPRALIPGAPYDTSRQHAALRRAGGDVLADGLGGPGRYPALRAVLRRAPPRTGARAVDSDLQTGPFDLEEAKRIVEGLDGSHLFIQGPPGSGKTYTGAHLILHLLARGKRIGVAAQSHKAIHRLLKEVERFAAENGQAFRGLKKFSDAADRYESPLEQPLIGSSSNNAAFADTGLDLIAGTAWLFSREEMDGTLDYLFIDEAGQISLADALAMGTSAGNLVLLGDPLQLAQVTQGTHPPGSGVSVLEHLLGGHGTIPPERGLFIDETRRMHPDVCRFISEAVYEGRLESFEECANQRIDAQGELTGTGVRWIPVEHEGNTRSSEEEADAIAEAIDDLRGATYTRVGDGTGALTPDDIMVVTPYNAQVRCLRERLPQEIPVGTVDKFQGQEAAVVFFSMATSSGTDVPRNIEFLFSRNRLNVAVSRARCLAILVCNPELLNTRCRTADQMRLVNALCTLVEFASEE